jgi:glycosyltransferase involved in cell wall biosynthesis
VTTDGPGRRRVLITCGVFEPGFRGGGPVRSVAQIVDTVPEDIEVTLVTRDRDVGRSPAYPGLSGSWVRRSPRCRVFYLNAARPGQWLRLYRELRATPFDLLYVNSLWALYTVLAVVAARLGVIRVNGILLAPRGELSPGALSLKSVKKRLFLAWWAPFLRHAGVRWHATGEREAAEIRAACPWADVEINDDCTGLPMEPVAGSGHEGPSRLVFISRICAKKNLALVLQALQGISRPVVFDIYGPAEDARYWSRCRSLIDKLPPTVAVRYRGELPPARVRDAFAGYDAFVFPTLGENFGHVIAESLSASCPVICSDTTPWTPVLAAGGGAIFSPPDVASLRRELERLAAMSPAQRLAARNDAGRAYRLWRGRVHAQNILEQAGRVGTPVLR